MSLVEYLEQLSPLPPKRAPDARGGRGVKNGREIPCALCGTPKYYSQALIDRSKTGLFFCSPAHMGEYKHKVHMGGLDRSSWPTHCENPACGLPLTQDHPSEPRHYCSRDCWRVRASVPAEKAWVTRYAKYGERGQPEDTQEWKSVPLTGDIPDPFGVDYD